MSKPINNWARKRRAIDESGELLRLAVEVGSIGIFDSDLEEERTQFSPELCAILGLPAGTEMAREEALELVDERDRAAVIASVEAACAAVGDGRWSSVHRVTRLDGAVRWVSVQGRLIHRDSPNGPQPVRSIGTVIDITHLKETEAALRESERRLRFALDAAQMGTFNVDIPPTQAHIDEQEARLFGLPEDTRQVSVDELRKRVPVEDLQASDAKKKRLMEDAEAYHHEFRIDMPDGSERWLSAYADVRADRIFGVNFDVTQRKRSEAALRESEARLRIATSGAALGIFEWHVKTDHAVWENDRIYEIFGRSRADGPLSKQQFVSNYLHRGDVDDFEVALREAMQTCSNFHTVCRIRRKDGSRRWLQIDGKFDVTSTGEPLRLVGVVADITTRKTLQRRAKKLSEQLITVQEEERRTIAQELHNSTVQHLVAASLTMMLLRPKAPLEITKERLWNDAEGCIAEAMKELRTFSYLMHPPALQGRQLRLSLQQYTDGFASRCGIDIKLRSSANIDKLPVNRQRLLFRIVQEALSNLYRNASASHASVELRCTARRVHVVVTDNGRCMADVDEKRASLRPGVGMRGIKARLGRLGGTLRITQAKPCGTRLHAALRVASGVGG